MSLGLGPPPDRRPSRCEYPPCRSTAWTRSSAALPKREYREAMSSLGENRDLDSARETYAAGEAELLQALGTDFDRTELTRRAAEVSESANRWEGAALDAVVRLREQGDGDPVVIGEIETEAERALAVRDLWWKIRDALLGREVR